QAPGLTVTGRSLGLAVLLAAWAARRCVTLLPLVATGTIRDRRIEQVDGVYRKALCVRDYLRLPGVPAYRLIVPEANRGDVPAGGPETLTVGPDLAGLFAQEGLFTDGCAGYRSHLLAQGDDFPDDGLRRITDALFILPFDNEPRFAVQHL